jgi:hypothetical protein
LDGGNKGLLKNQMKQFIITIIEKQQALKQTEVDIEIYKEERDYIKKHELLSDELKGTLTFVESNPITRFEDAYIERGHKETEEVIAIETFSFLDHSVKYLKEHMEEFIYLESKWLELIGVDAISLEVDDVFGTYDVMLGLKLQKKHEKIIRDYLNEELNGQAEAFDLMFNQNDGMWDLNFTLDYIRDFNQDISLGEAYCLIYRVLFKLVETVEEVNDK